MAPAGGLVQQSVDGESVELQMLTPPSMESVEKAAPLELPAVVDHAALELVPAPAEAEKPKPRSRRGRAGSASTAETAPVAEEKVSPAPVEAAPEVEATPAKPARSRGKRKAAEPVPEAAAQMAVEDEPGTPMEMTVSSEHLTREGPPHRNRRVAAPFGEHGDVNGIARRERRREVADRRVGVERPTELDAISSAYPAQAIAAGASWAHGCLALVSGDPSEAARRFRRARQHWSSIDAPYETARAATLLAESLASGGDVDGAALELEAARATFTRLGALPDVRVVDDLLASSAPPVSSAPVRRTLVFTDIVGSTALLEAIGDDAWSDLRRWHDETLRRCVAEHGGEEVDHAGDGFFVAFGDASAAAACAIEIQRRLAEHRRRHGFAPQVRIGIHAADATKDNAGYSGLGVHTAARIGAIAGGGEIVASAATASGMTAITLIEPRAVELKGIAEPVEVVSIDWR